MSQPVPTTHPAVVLRSHYTHLRALLAAAVIAVLGLTAAAVLLATDDQRSASVSAAPAITAPAPSGARYDGGPEEGSAALIQRSATPTSKPGARYDGGPDEGTTGPSH